jgi:hypothetical protein
MKAFAIEIIGTSDPEAFHVTLHLSCSKEEAQQLKDIQAKEALKLLSGQSFLVQEPTKTEEQ